MRKLKNHELLTKYKKNRERGTVASEMCRRAGTIKFLLKHCTDNDKSFNSCMRDTVEVLSKRKEDNF